MDTFALTTVTQTLYSGNQGRQAISFYNPGSVDAIITTDNQTPSATLGGICKANGGYLTISGGSASTVIQAATASGTTTLIGMPNLVAIPTNPGAFLTGPSGGTVALIQPASDGQSLASQYALLTEAVPKLLNNSGTFDRLQGYFGGSIKDRNTTLEGEEGQVIVLLRAILLTLTATNELLGVVNATTKYADELEMESIIKRATKGSPTDPNTLQ